MFKEEVVLYHCYGGLVLERLEGNMRLYLWILRGDSVVVGCVLDVWLVFLLAVVSIFMVLASEIYGNHFSMFQI